MRVVFIGNCQAKALSEYFNQANESVSSFESIYFKYVLDDLETWNTNYIEEADIFIYQDASIDTLTCATVEKNKKDYIPKAIADRLKSKGKLCISFPSIYFSAYFPDAVSTSEARDQFVENAPKEWFPNWTLSRKVVETIRSAEDVQSKIKIILDPLFLDDDTLDTCWRKTYQNLKNREIANHVDIPMADWMRANWQTQRLMHITNHPTRITLQYLMDKILDILEKRDIAYPSTLRTIIMQSADTMIKSGRVPILPCVLKHCAEDFDREDSFAWINGIEIDNWHEYVEFYSQSRAS